MKFEQTKEESPEGFRRLTGIQRATFDVMIMILDEADAEGYQGIHQLHQHSELPVNLCFLSRSVDKAKTAVLVFKI